MNRTVIYLLTLGVFLTATAELVVAGILNVIAEEMNVSIAMAGQLISAYSLALAIGTPIVISMTSRMGRKKLLSCALSFFIAGCLLSSFSNDYSMLMVSRAILGLSAGVFLVVSFSTVAKLVPPEKIGSTIGTIILGFSCAIVLGVPIGITITNWMNWHLIFIILAFLSILILLGIIRLLPKIEGDIPVPFKNQLIVLASPVILTGLFITFFRDTGNSIMYTYLTPFLEDILLLRPTTIGLIMLLFGVFGVIGSRLGGFAADKWGTKRIILLCITVHAVSLAILPMVTSLQIAGLAILAVWVFSMFVVAPALQTYFIQEAPQSSSLVLSLNTSITHLALAAGAGLGGVAASSASSVFYHPWVASLTIGLGLIAAIVSFSIRQNKQTVPA
ncbi:MFS transporter [Paenibacillus sp. LHD-117]|uniref:MFS transporter n=1 Tax=Paenibacillus sp. LHD-117 TaxID=3071412 RepID=UPI0027E1380F|nr:MFS transporter [Paenibacillus sp. LHD-117]MDQ6418437.1 MFS transporter [Paenibacillus sp. LHD-117]